MGLTPDFLTPPLSPLEQVLAFTLGAATRGVVVGTVTAIVIGVLPGAGLASPTSGRPVFRRRRVA
jgi:ABC-2 type transport system permease protein